MAETFGLRLLGHPANANLLKYLGSPSRLAGSRWADNPSCSPDTVEQPFLRLGTHPDVVEQLWKRLASTLPVECSWVVYGKPVLVHPTSAVIFAFGTGTIYALRFPNDALQQAVKLGARRSHTFGGGSVLDLSDFGDEWIFGRWFKDEGHWCLRAFEYAQNG